MKQSQKQVNFALFLVFIALTLGLIFSLNRQAKAAAGGKLYFLPATGSFEAGKTFSVRLAAESDVINFNLVETNLSFSSDTLQVTSLSKDGSVVTLWFAEPTFSNSDGAISVSGGIPTPGYVGIGRIIIINFKAKAAGSAWIKIDSGQILANDGLGTDILSGSGQANFTIYSSGLPQPKIVQPTAPTTLVKISSSTHPSPNKWYNNKKVLLSWTWSQGITNYSFIFDQKATTIPDNTGEGMNTSVAYSNVDDGVWYFHLKAKTGSDWLSAVNFKINIDSVPPEITKINLPDNGQTYNSNPQINIEAKDGLSGIEYYTLKIDDGDLIKQESPNYELKNVNLSSGLHKITVQTFDLAGNSQAQAVDLQIYSLPIPTITYYTKQDFLAYDKSTIRIRGMAIPLAEINVSLINNEQKTTTELKARADSAGNWTIDYSRVLMPGQYTAQAIASYQGQVSLPSAPINFKVITAGIKIFGYVLPQTAIVNLIIFLSCCVLILLIILAIIIAKIKKYPSLQKYILSKFNIKKEIH